VTADSSYPTQARASQSTSASSPETRQRGIIDQQTFDAARQLRHANKLTSARRLADPEKYLLRSGFVFCGECGNRLYIHRQSPGYGLRTSYWCTSRNHGHDLPPEQRRRNGVQVAIRADTLDSAVWERVVDLLDNPDHLTAEIDRMRANDNRDGSCCDRPLTGQGLA
jgi:site-specific DNA recombinase